MSLLLSCVNHVTYLLVVIRVVIHDGCHFIIAKLCELSYTFAG